MLEADADKHENEEFARSQAAREEHTRGNALTETLRASTNPETILTTVRKLLHEFEDPKSSFFHDKWTLAQAFRTLEDRKNVFSLTNAELDLMGIKKDGIPGYALRMEKAIRTEAFEEREFNPDTNKRKRVIRERDMVVEIPYYGTDAERQELARFINEVEKEMVSRYKVHSMYEAYLATAGTLGEMAKLFFTPLVEMPNPSDFRRIFSLPDIKELREGKKDNTEFGNRINRAMRALVIVGLSERPDALRYLKATPGWKILFPTDKDEQTLLGNLSGWQNRMLGVNQEGGVNPRVNFYEEERGGLTKYGDIFNKTETEEEVIELRRSISKLVGDPEAEELAWRLFHLFGLAAEFGGSQITLDPNTGSYEQKISVEGFPASDDLVKIFNLELNRGKQARNFQPGGPRGSLGKYPNFLVDFLKFANVYMERDAKGRPQETSRRSFFELWWNGYLGEKCLNLGDKEFPWEKLSESAWRDFLLRIFMAGREEKGLLPRIMKVSWKTDEFMDLLFWTELNQAINTIIGDWIVTGGFYEGKTKNQIDQLKKNQKVAIQHWFWEGVKSLPQYRAMKAEQFSEGRLVQTHPYKITKIIEIAQLCGWDIAE